MARIRNIALVAVSILALLAGLLALYSVKERRVAEEQRKQADHILASATKIYLALITHEQNTPTMKEAFALFQTGADHGDTASMGNLGRFYAEGVSVTRDYAKAREWYEKAADKGDADAMTNLGALFENGLGVAQDYAKAREWYEKAADKGDAEAMTSQTGWIG